MVDVRVGRVELVELGSTGYRRRFKIVVVVVVNIVPLVVDQCRRRRLNKAPLELARSVRFGFVVVRVARFARRVPVLRSVRGRVPVRRFRFAERHFQARAVVHLGIGFDNRPVRGARRRRPRNVIINRRRFRGVRRRRFAFTDRVGRRNCRHGWFVYNVFFVAIRIRILFVLHVEHLHRFFWRFGDNGGLWRRRRRRQRLVRFLYDDLDDGLGFLVIVRRAVRYIVRRRTVIRRRQTDFGGARAAVNVDFRRRRRTVADGRRVQRVLLRIMHYRFHLHRVRRDGRRSAVFPRIRVLLIPRR